jgi:hypothetical protein
MACFASIAPAEERKLPPQARVLDPDVIMGEWPDATVSPDGQWVAYVSKGFVSVCNVRDPAPRRLFEVPNSQTHVFARPEYRYARGDSRELYRAMGKDGFQKLTDEISNNIYGLNWTHDSDGVVLDVQSYENDNTNPGYVNRYVSLHGAVTILSSVGPDAVTTAIGGAILTRDRRFLVAPGYERSLIWDVATNKPRATSFSNLTPSSTSGRWIGIEKDTRQLVMTDEDFKIIKRFEEHKPTWSFDFKLNWSPDERFIIWRNQVGFDYYSNWEGFWMNLETGVKRELSGRFMDERIAFTGRGGEFFRCGQDGVQAKWSGDQITGAHLTILPEGLGPPQDVWRITLDPKKLVISTMNPPILAGPRCELFALGMPRPLAERPGRVWHLIDRKGNTWRFPGADSGDFISPYDVVGFAENGKTIIAHDRERLFSIPISAIQAATNKID